MSVVSTIFFSRFFFKNNLGRMCVVKLCSLYLLILLLRLLFGCSFVDETGKQLISSDDTGNSVELGSGGSELIITRRNNDGRSVRTLGSREFLRYYREKLRPTRTNDVAISAALAARYVFDLFKSVHFITTSKLLFEQNTLSFQVPKHGSCNCAVKRANG